ncbi:MAG: serine hydrolase domain-containing protein, partial [Polyangiaceae bacterium]
MARTPAEIAHIVVAAGVADACATGWARIEGGRFVEARGGAVAWDRTGAPRDSTTRPEDVFFDLASVTKPMVAVSLAESELARATPLREVLPEAQSTRSADVSLERLVSHRAGLEANLPLFVRIRDGQDSPALRATLLSEAADARRAGCEGAVPADGFPALYSDLGYVLAGVAMARALGAVDAGALVETRVAARLGLEQTLGTARSLTERGVRLADVVAPTEVVPWRGGVVRAEVHDENAWMLTGRGGSGHAGMFGTVGAVLAFGRHVLTREKALAWTHAPRPGGTLRAGFDGKSEEGSSAGVVLGPRAFGHLGFTGTSLWIDPDAGVVVALLTNRVHPTRENQALRA